VPLTAPPSPLADPDLDATTTAGRVPPRRTRPVVLVVLAALVLALVGVWAAGGFEPRRDRVSEGSPGRPVATGPYELVFDRATVRHLTTTDLWTVQVLGTGRTTGDATISLPSGTAGGTFVYAKDRVSGEVQPVTGFGYGDGSDVLTNADALTPGLGPVALSSTFTFAAQPSAEIVLVVFALELSDRSLLQDQDPAWNTTPDATRLVLPLERLPDSGS
jgi:hypothetical protein